MSYFHLGIDYGTSAGKIIIRDYDAPGGEKAYPVYFDNSIRIPSDLAVADKTLYFGRAKKSGTGIPAGAIWYESVKMRVAARHGAALYGTPFAEQAPPTGWTFDDLATLSVAWLIGKGREAARFHTAPAEPQCGMTLGVPSDFYYKQETRSAFLKIARVAWSMSRRHPLGSDHVVLDARLKDQLVSAQREADGDPITDESTVALWLRSEARASVWWAWESPELTTEPYINVDVGAGTTNTAAYFITATKPKGSTAWVKSGIAVFGAASGTVGMNVLGTSPGAAGMSIPILRPTATVTPRAPRNPLRVEFEKPYRDVLMAADRLTNKDVTAAKQWHHARPMLMGGGSLSADVCQALQFHPSTPSVKLLPIFFDRTPSDLRLKKDITTAEARVSLTVAYGLSVTNDALPPEVHPGQMVPLEKLPPRLEPSSVVGVYEK